MKIFIIAILSLFVLAVPATAGNPSLCQKEGWTTAQSDNGSSFNSLAECARSREVFKPTLTLFRTHITDFDPFQITGTGFHTGQQNKSAVLSFALTGQAPFLYLGVGLEEDGSFDHVAQFGPCAPNTSYDLTLTLTDSSGVHASAQIILC